MLKIVFILSIVLVYSRAAAQWGDETVEEGAPWQDRIFTGGGLSASFGSYIDFVSVSPLLGYRINEKLATGIGFTYRYTSYKIVSPKVSTNDYGLSPFMRYNVYKNIFLHTEYEYLNYEIPISINESVRKGFGSFLAGGGLFQPIGKRAGFFLLALYNFSYRNPASQNTVQPYDSPWILRAGITTGF